MKLKLLFVMGIFISLSMVSCAEALPAGVNPSQGPGSSSSNAIGTEASASIGPVYYWVFFAGPVQKQVLDASNTINILGGMPLFIQFKGKVAGNENTQKGGMFIWDASRGTYSHAMLITPTKWSKLTTYPPLRYTAAGDYLLTLYVCAPDGTYVDRGITIHVHY